MDYNVKKILRKFFPRQLFSVYSNLQIILFRMINKEYFGLENFPLDMFSRVAFYKYPFFNDSHKDRRYFAQFYRERFVTGSVFDVRSYVNYTAEILEGNYVTSGNIIFNNKINSLLPISLPSTSTDDTIGSIELDINGDVVNLEGLKQNTFHYLPIDKDSKVEIKFNQSLIVGKPIPTEQKKKNSKKLVVTLFIDGLSSKVIDKESISNLMPNTSIFFGSGVRLFNCISSSEWTLPSVASISSGLYSLHHGVTNPRGKIEVGVGYKLLAEYFQESGYLTAKFCSNERKNPYYGYMKGFDRTIYKMQMDCHEVITAAIEHLHTFNERDNYLWLSFFDLHHHLNHIPDISSQKSNLLRDHTYKKNILNSPFLSYDEKLENWYKNEASRLDVYLQLLYSYILENYDMKDVIISLVSDHGQAYAGTQKDLLSEQKLTTPMMYVGGGVNSCDSDEIVQNIDYLPTLLKLSGLNDKLNIDGSVPLVCGGSSARQFSFSESIYPNRKYEVSIYDKEYMFYLMSNDKLKNINDFDLNKCIYKLVSRIDNQNVTNNNQDVCDYYLKHISDHIRGAL
jgi:hypothetical protein